MSFHSVTMAAKSKSDTIVVGRYAQALTTHSDFADMSCIDRSDFHVCERVWIDWPYLEVVSTNEASIRAYRA
jgi:hypothetical protein